MLQVRGFDKLFIVEYLECQRYHLVFIKNKIIKGQTT